MGTRRGGFSTEVHLACDGKGRPLSVVVTTGQRNEAPLLGELLDAIRVARPERRPGRPRKRPNRSLANLGYAHDSCRALLRTRGVSSGMTSGATRPSGVEAYRRRNAVKRCVKRLKQWRGVKTRYEEQAANYRAVVLIAALMICLAA